MDIYWAHFKHMTSLYSTCELAVVIACPVHQITSPFKLSFMTACQHPQHLSNGSAVLCVSVHLFARSGTGWHGDWMRGLERNWTVLLLWFVLSNEWLQMQKRILVSARVTNNTVFSVNITFPSVALTHRFVLPWCWQRPWNPLSMSLNGKRWLFPFSAFRQ